MTENKRIAGIDMLRIFSMMMVIALHVLSYSDDLNKVAFGSAGYFLSWFIETGSICAVDVFALVSGFVMCKSEFKLYRLLQLWVPVFFYSVAFEIAAVLAGTRPFSIHDLVVSCLPVSRNTFWYASAYLGMYCFVPFMNAIISKLDRKTIFSALVVTLIVFSVYQTVFLTDIFGTNRGYSMLWIIIMYYLGAYIRTYDIKHSFPAAMYLAVFFGNSVLLLASHFLLTKFLGNSYSLVLIQYTSPFVVVNAICLVQVFRKINLSSAKLQKSVVLAGSVAFEVYVLHMQLMRYGLMKSILAFVISVPWYLLLPAVIILCLAVYVICGMCEFARSTLFRIVRIDWLLKQASDSLIAFKQKRTLLGEDKGVSV